MIAIHDSPFDLNISARAVSPSPDNKLIFPTPLTVIDIKTYIIMHKITDKIIAIGTSLFGFLASSLIVVMKSKPR